MADPKDYARIYLQGCDDPESDWNNETTWCWDRIHNDDVEYVNAKLYEALRAENEALRRDAERYQGIYKGLHVYSVHINEVLIDADEMTKEQFDAAIDAAIQEERK